TSRTTRTCLPRRLGREGRGPRRNIVRSDTFPTQCGSFACPTDCAMCGEYLLPPLSKVRAVCGSTACTDLRGGRRVIGVPTATCPAECDFDVQRTTERSSFGNEVCGSPVRL